MCFETHRNFVCVGTRVDLYREIYRADLSPGFAGKFSKFGTY